MDFDLTEAIESLDPNEVFAIANEAQPAGNYLFNSILPNRNEDTYSAEGGSMTIRTTMAGLSGMDSEYNRGGAAETEEWSYRTAKLTITNTLPEELLRKLQQMMLRLRAGGLPTTDAVVNTALNFVNKIIVQALLDREEWLKAQACFTGKLDWTHNGKRLQVDYGMPAANIFANRAGTDRYGSTTSKLWTDIYSAYLTLNWDIRAFVTSPRMMKDILANMAVNELQLVDADVQAGRFAFRRYKTISGNTVISTDPRDTLTILVHNKEVEIWDLANPGKTKKVPVVPVNAILAIGSPVDTTAFRVGDGATAPPPSPVAIGYGHVGPTVEGGGRPGRWTRLFVPENEPWQMKADGVENFLPVIEAPDRLVVMTSDNM